MDAIIVCVRPRRILITALGGTILVVVVTTRTAKLRPRVGAIEERANHRD